jgi:hypothetical protein
MAICCSEMHMVVRINKDTGGGNAIAGTDPDHFLTDAINRSSHV